MLVVLWAKWNAAKQKILHSSLLYLCIMKENAANLGRRFEPEIGKQAYITDLP